MCHTVLLLVVMSLSYLAYFKFNISVALFILVSTLLYG